MSSYEWIDEKVPAGLEIRQVYGFVFSPDGRVLLLEDKGTFNLPGGKPEIDENFSETLIREAAEEVHITITSPNYLGYQLVTTEEEFAQVRLIALIDQIRPTALDPSTGRKYLRLWVPPEQANEFLKWGESGKLQLTSAVAATARLGVIWSGAPFGYI